MNNRIAIDVLPGLKDGAFTAHSNKLHLAGQLIDQMMTYMPDSARAEWKGSLPLPPYLQKEFAQSIDRTRPRELLTASSGKKLVSPNKAFNLRYRYLDTGEEVLVPNTWYNQTKEMRLDYWEFEVARQEEAVAKLKAELRFAESCLDTHIKGTPRAKVLQTLQWGLTDRMRVLEAAKAAKKRVQNDEELI